MLFRRSTKLTKIRTPLIYRWHRFRVSGLSVVVFVLAAILTVWLWQRQAQFGQPPQIPVPATETETIPGEEKQGQEPMSSLLLEERFCSSLTAVLIH
jgi:hypothetical protein